MPELIAFEPDQIIARYLDEGDLDRYYAILMELNQQVNLVSRETTRESFRRLVAESLLPLERIGVEARSLLDIGSGGGMPSIPLLLALRSVRRAVLLERTLKKAKALRTIVSELGLPAEVVDRNHDEYRADTRFDLVTIRLVKLTERLLGKAIKETKSTGRIVYWSTPQFPLGKHDADIHNFKSPQDEVSKSFTIISR